MVQMVHLQFHKQRKHLTWENVQWIAQATMDRVDLWHARLALKTLRLEQRQAIAEAAED